MLFIIVPLDFEALTESLFVPCVLFICVVIRVVGRDGICDCLLVYAYNLVEILD